MPETRVLSIERVSKSFPGVHALDNVSFDIALGCVNALVGENGAGKSTLVKILAGALAPDDGRIALDGKVLEIRTPKTALRDGISTIYQHLHLVPDLDAVANIFLGKELAVKGTGLISDSRAMSRKVRELLDFLGVEISVGVPVRELPLAEQQIIAICKAIQSESRVIIMDEPTSSLSAREIEKLFEVIRRLKAKGMTFVYISHRLEEIFRIADRVTVLRNGRVIISDVVARFTQEDIVQAIVGHRVDERPINVRAGVSGQTVLRLTGVRKEPRLVNVDLVLRKGEILGILSQVGSGRSELAEILFGMARPDSGLIEIRGNKLDAIRSPGEAIRRSISYIPEDRHRQGLVLLMNVMLNSVLVRISRMVRAFLFLDFPRIRSIFQKYREQLQIKVTSERQLALELSGGNQQKVVLAKWLVNDSDILIMSEPTHGIDVGTKVEIRQIIYDISEQGKSIIILSTEVPELMNISDRIAILKQGQIVRVFDKAEFDQTLLTETLLSKGTGNGR